ncbi:helix-turn-helix domain-containing protein [Clostridium botulinum]|uniref:helix-turn-helix domain-containing protein n=1 Tax=Clostridium botulinum TaxID=1491 RepID=UPI000773A10B|nr:helix-turn-helix domain-containing protein [Clostridium botulinum]
MGNKDEIQIIGVLSKGYGIMPKMVALDKDLAIEAKAIYAFLTSFAGVGQGAFPSVKTILHYLKISEKRYYKYRQQLIKSGYITVKPRYSGNKRISNIYILNMNFVPSQIESVQNESVQNESVQFEGSNNNNINNNNINNNKYNNIFVYWNSKNIINHKKITKEIEKAIDKALKVYTEDEIIQAIDMYKEILESDFYFNYKWSLRDFLTRKNGISTFLDEGSNKINYKEWREKSNGANRNGGVGQDLGKKRFDIKIETNNKLSDAERERAARELI